MSLFVFEEKIFGTPVLRTPVMKYHHHDKRELKINAMISVDFKHFNLNIAHKKSSEERVKNSKVLLGGGGTDGVWGRFGRRTTNWEKEHLFSNKFYHSKSSFQCSRHII
jgi:hypothetical protein